MEYLSKSVFCWVQSNFQILRSVKCFVCKRQVLLLILSNTKFNSIFGTTFFLTFHITNSVFTVLLHRMMYYSALRTAFFSVYLEWMDNFDSSPVNFGTDCGNIGHWPMDFRLNSCWPPNAIDLHGKMIEKNTTAEMKIHLYFYLSWYSTFTTDHDSVLICLLEKWKCRTARQVLVRKLSGTFSGY